MPLCGRTVLKSCCQAARIGRAWGQRGEQGLVEQLVPQPAVEALNEGVLLGFARGGSGQERLAARHLPALNIKLGAIGVEHSAPG
jgi:hypothetical protein